MGSTGGPEDDGSSADLPALPAWQQQALVGLQLAGPGANTEVTIRRAAAGAAGSSSSGSSKAADTAAAAAGEGSPVDPRLLAGVRVLCAPNEAVLGGRSGVSQLGRWDAPLAAPAAELAALRTLTGLCAIALSQFQGTVEDDAALLAGAGAGAAAAQQAEQQQQQREQEQQQQAAALTADQELAVRFRMDKKQLLLEALSAISQRIKQVAAAASTAAPTSGSRQAGGKQASGGSPGSKGKGKVPASKGGGKGFAK